MTAQSGVERRSLLQKAGGWFFRVIFKKGWPRRLVLAAAVAIFILAALALTGGVDYREEPSALAPRSADVYMETRDLPALLKNISSWPVWKEERRVGAEEDRNQLQVDIAGLISDQLAGMSTSSPMRWLAAASQAAYCLSSAPEPGAKGSWALYINMPNPADALAEIEVERGMTVQPLRTTKEGSVFKLTSAGAGELHFAVIAPWLILSSDKRLPEFALESVRKPAFSLANSGLLPKWKRGTAFRSVYNPAYDGAASKRGLSAIVRSWMAPDTRIVATAKIEKNGLQTTFASAFLSDRVRGGGLWSIFMGVLFLVAIAALLVIFATLLAMVGWGGWLKSRAVRAGIAPAAAPEPVEPTDAFKEDSGLTTGQAPADSLNNTTGAAPEQADVPETGSPISSQYDSSGDASQ